MPPVYFCSALDGGGGSAHAPTALLLAPRAGFRRHAFGLRSQPVVQRVKQAVAEIKRVARRDPVLAAKGAVLLLERLSPAFEQVDSSSGAIGAAVHHAFAGFAPLIASAPADARTRTAWLERLFQAHAEDRMPYIEGLAASQVNGLGRISQAL